MTTDNLAGSGDQNPKKKRSGSNKRQRGKITPIRWEMEEFNRAAGRARKTGLTFGAWIRALAQDGDAGPRAQRTPPLHVELLNEVKGMIGRVGNNVNQIAHRINADEFYDIPEIRLVLRQVLQITDNIMVALGKEPSPELQDWDNFAQAAKKVFIANPGAQTITLPADLVRCVIENTHGRAVRHPSERPATGLEPDTPPSNKPPSSKFLSPEGHA